MNRSHHMRLLRSSNRRLTQPVRLPEPAGGFSSGLFLAVPAFFGVMITVSAVTGWSLSPASWLLARATGLTLYLLFWGTVVIGLLLTTRSLDRVVSKSTLLSLHSYVSRLAYAFLAGHLLSLVIDQHLPFSIEQLVVPFGAPSVEPWTGFGTLAMYLFVVIVVSVSLRRYIPYQVWRFLHVLAFPMFALSLLHGFGAGSDSGSRIVQALYLLTSATVLFLSFLRLTSWNGRGQTHSLPAKGRPFDRLGGQTIMHRQFSRAIEMNVLVVEDEVRLADLIARTLRREQFVVTSRIAGKSRAKGHFLALRV